MKYIIRILIIAVLLVIATWPAMGATVYQAESAKTAGVAVIAGGRLGWVDLGGKTASIKWGNIKAEAPGTYLITFRYSNGSGSDRPCKAFINGTQGGTLAFKPTKGWNSWFEASIKSKLVRGTNTITLVPACANGPNIDYLSVNRMDPATPTHTVGPKAYYVSPGGSDLNDGLSPGKPLQNPQTAADMTNPGDTVYFMKGTYTYDSGGIQLFIDRSGDVDKATGKPRYITYKAYKDHKPVLSATNAWQHIEVQASYIRIEGLTIKGNNPNLTLKEGEKVYDYYVDCKDKGEDVDWGTFTHTNTGGISIEGRGRVQKGLEPLHHIEVRNCTVYDCPSGGIGAMEADWITFEGNTVHDNAWYTVFACSGISILHSIDLDKNTTDYKNIIRNNILYNNETKVKWIETRNYSDGNGIIIDDNKCTQINWKPYQGKTLVANNLSYGNGGSGIHAYSSSNADIVNNTVFHNSHSPYLKYAQIFGAEATDCNFLNNIVYGQKDKPINGLSGSQRVIFANNLYFGGTPVAKGINDIVADPRFVSTEAGKYDFHLLPDSPAIGMGTRTLAPGADLEGNPRPHGNRYDIGAYEAPYPGQAPIVNDIVDLTGINDKARFVNATGQALWGTPVIDGIIDPIWDKTQRYAVNRFNNGAPGAKGFLRALWDDMGLSVLMEVEDYTPGTSATTPRDQDSVEFFLDENNAKTQAMQPDDGLYRVGRTGAKSVGTRGKAMKPGDFEAAVKTTPTGYTVEARIPLTSVKPTEGTTLGFDVMVNDDKGAGYRESASKWSDNTSASPLSTVKWGNLRLVKELGIDLTPVLIWPTTCLFLTDSPADITINTASNNNMLTAIRNGDHTLVQGEDYTVEGEAFTIHKAYLSALPKGKAVITFDYTAAVDREAIVFIE